MLRIQHCHCYGLGCCYGMGSIPDLGNFHMLRSWQNKEPPPKNPQNPHYKTMKPEAESRVAEQFSWVPLSLAQLYTVVLRPAPSTHSFIHSTDFHSLDPRFLIWLLSLSFASSLTPLGAIDFSHTEHGIFSYLWASKSSICLPEGAEPGDQARLEPCFSAFTS